MSDLFFNIDPVNDDLREEIRQKIDFKTKPVGALGVLEEVALKIGLIQQSSSPVLQNPVVAIFAADHGIAKEGKVSAYPQEVTWQMVQNFLRGGAAVNVFCRTHGLTPKIIDAGVAFDFPGHDLLIDRKIAKGTRNYLDKPAMSREECLKAIRHGAGLVDQWHQEGTNIIGFGEMGIGNTSSASIITSLLTGRPIEKCTGKGTGLDKKGVRQKANLLAKAIQKHELNDDPLSVLETFGGFEIAMMAGGMLRAAEYRIALIIDGFIVTAALMMAHRLYPAVLDYALFAHTSDEAGHRIQLDHLGATPMLDLGMRLGEGSGAAMAYPVIKSAVNFLNEMASFEDAGVSQGGAL